MKFAEYCRRFNKVFGGFSGSFTRCGSYTLKFMWLLRADDVGQPHVPVVVLSLCRGVRATDRAPRIRPRPELRDRPHGLQVGPIPYALHSTFHTLMLREGLYWWRGGMVWWAPHLTMHSDIFEVLGMHDEGTGRQWWSSFGPEPW